MPEDIRKELETADRLHCVRQLDRDSWEYRTKRADDPPSCDDVMLVDDLLALLDAARTEA